MKVPDAASDRLRSPAVRGWLRMIRIVQRIERIGAKQLRAWELSLAQFDVLSHVGAREGMTQQALADGLLVTKGNITQLLGRLAERGLLVRRTEGRVKRLYLTDAGRALYAQAVPAHEALIAEQFEALDPVEQRQLLKYLQQVDRSLPERSSQSVRGSARLSKLSADTSGARSQGNKDRVGATGARSG